MILLILYLIYLSGLLATLAIIVPQIAQWWGTETPAGRVLISAYGALVCLLWPLMVALVAVGRVAERWGRMDQP